MTGFEPLGLDHVVLRVRDQAASQRFYTDILGCTLDHVNEPIRLVQLRFGVNLIDLRVLDSDGMSNDSVIIDYTYSNHFVWE